MKEIAPEEIARIRNIIIGQFSQIEELINDAVYDYYKNTTNTIFVEDIFMTGLNGISLKIELLKRIIWYNIDIYADFLPSKKIINKFLQNIRDCSLIRNYFAHNSLMTITNDGFFRGDKSFDFTIDIFKKEQEFNEKMEHLWPILGWIIGHLRNSNLK